MLDACQAGDVAKLKKLLASEVVNFKHSYTGDSALVSHFT